MVKDEAPEHLSGVAMGLTNTTIMGIGAMLFQPLIGVLAHARGQDVPSATTLSVIGAQILALRYSPALGSGRPGPVPHD